MEKRLKIIVFPDTNPEFIQLQIDSFKKHMDDGNTDFIIYNSSVVNYDLINNICNENNIECINYTGDKNIKFPTKVVHQLNWFRDNVQNKSNDYFLFIHSDMFFINKLDYKRLLEKKKLYYNPQYRDTPFYKVHDGNFNYFYMWDGVLLFDAEYINNNNLNQFFDWDFIHGITDVGGKTQKLLENINKNDIGYFEFWTHHKITDNTLYSGLNGASHFTLNLNNLDKIQEGIQMGSKTFPYENDNDNYEKYIISKIMKLKEMFVDPFDFENPVDSDVIQILDEPIEKSPIFHFKSGSVSYNKNKFHKLEQIKKIIFRDEI